MNYEKVKLIAHNLKLLAQSLEDAIKEDAESYMKPDKTKGSRFGYQFDNDDDGYAD
ncbi:hypothetical protein SSZBM1_124 [Synechococcus phage S-SZBM1]|uniref:Uncharacterized protein n=1 Tax=Synechococcus phage S-SZBM1 TaxID=2926475 RepID=A0AC61TSP8_9CAUD|nr:hypothetical protein PP650_gp152 [Synechococcus phage S-SZBM1]UNH61241.1 hypothetical protein SSZBM1_124 [Synechococcus phage S-SZBM1]